MKNRNLIQPDHLIKSLEHAIIIMHQIIAGIIHMTGRTCMPGYYPDIPSGDDVKSQTAGVLKIIDNVLAKYGSDKEHILFAQVFLKDVIRDFDDMNEVWESWVTPGCEPARATVQAKMAKEEALVEIVVTAVRKDA